MKKLALLYSIVFTISLVTVWSVAKISVTRNLDNGEYRSFLFYAGIKKYSPTSQELAMTQGVGGEDLVIPQKNYSYFTSIQSNKAVYVTKVIPTPISDYTYFASTDLSMISLDSDMIYHDAYIALPLYDSDYYWGKYLDAMAGAKQLNYMPILAPGNHMAIIGDGYINIRPLYGYVQPPHYYFGSGVCWSSSTLGAMLDKANSQFKSKYGIDLVIYGSGDRSPHGGFYMTYTNNHHGYTIYAGNPTTDYRFRVNPAIANLDGMSDFKMKVVMLYTDNYPGASHGEALAAYIISNKEF